MSTHSAIEIQISARVQAPRNGRPISDRLIKDAIAHKADTGRDVPGITLKIVRWRHPPASRWTSARNSMEEWLRFGRFLPSASIIFSTPTKARSRRS